MIGRLRLITASFDSLVFLTPSVQANGALLVVLVRRSARFWYFWFGEVRVVNYSLKPFSVKLNRTKKKRDTANEPCILRYEYGASVKRDLGD